MHLEKTIDKITIVSLGIGGLSISMTNGFFKKRKVASSLEKSQRKKNKTYKLLADQIKSPRYYECYQLYAGLFDKPGLGLPFTINGFGIGRRLPRHH